MVKVAREGYNVHTANERYINIDSRKNQLKEYSSGSGTINVARSGGIGNVREVVEIEHNLGYQPFFSGWFKNVDASIWYRVPDAIDIDDEGFFSGISRPTDNVLQLWFYTVELFTDDYDEDLDYYYIIYIDPYKDAWS